MTEEEEKETNQIRFEEDSLKVRDGEKIA